MRYICDAPGDKTWFRLETAEEAAAGAGDPQDPRGESSRRSTWFAPHGQARRRATSSVRTRQLTR